MNTASSNVLLPFIDVLQQINLINKLLVIGNIKKHIGGTSILHNKSTCKHVIIPILAIIGMKTAAESARLRLAAAKGVSPQNPWSGLQEPVISFLHQSFQEKRAPLGNSQYPFVKPDIALYKLYSPSYVLVMRIVYKHTHGFGLCVSGTRFSPDRRKKSISRVESSRL